MSVDESWRMRADPDLTAGWTAAQLGSVLVHHVCHLLRTHGERAQAVGVTSHDARRWVQAADAEINDDLIPAGLDLPGRPVLPARPRRPGRAAGRAVLRGEHHGPFGPKREGGGGGRLA